MSQLMSKWLTPTAVCAVAGSALAVAAGGQTVFINELHYINAGMDVGEFVEVCGPAGTDLAGWSVELHNGGSGAVYDTIALGGVIDDEDDGFGAVDFAHAGIQNGSPDGLALVDDSSAVIEFLCYGGSFTALGGAADGLLCTDMGVAETSPVHNAGQSLQRTGTGLQASDFVWTGPGPESPGFLNCGQMRGEPPAPVPGLAHRYSFCSDASDSVGAAHGAVVDAGTMRNFSFVDGELDLSANTGEGSGVFTEDAYVNLPNFIVSAAANSGQGGALTFEFWFTLAASHTYQRLGDFGTSNFGEEVSALADAADWLHITPSSGFFADGLEMENHPATNAGFPRVGLTGPFPLGVEQHVVAVYDHNDTSAGPNGSMHLYLNAVELLDTGDSNGEVHPDLDLNSLDDNNNWLGRSQWNDPLFDGSYNEFRIYNIALNAADVAANFSAGPDVIPEPASILQLCFGAVALVALRRRAARRRRE